MGAGRGARGVILLLGCALRVHAVGLVEPAEAGVTLRELDGDTWSLVTQGGAAPVGWLHGCVVEVEGARLGRRLVVEEWRVQDAGDGSGGFVGTLRLHGARLLIDDRNTGTTLVVDDAVVPQLRAWAGQPVLLIGYISGPATVSPVAWRLLAPEPGPPG